MFRLILIAMLLAAAPVIAGSQFLDVLPADYVSYGQFATPGADTLWFTKATPTQHSAAALQLADWYPPMMTPFSAEGGELQMSNRRVKFVRFFSRAPFSLLIDSPVGKDAVATYVYVDSTQFDGVSVASTRMNKFPCVYLVQGYPDSIKVKEAGSDTVRFDLGY